jgi:predicted acetyltransferase
MALTLIHPAKYLESDFRAAISEFRTMGEKTIASTFSYYEDDFDIYLQLISDAKKGVNLPTGFVTYSTYWLVENNNRIIGFCNLRHYLNDALKIEGGHIGYAIRPSERRKNYGTIQLNLLLDECRNRKMDKVMITCDFDNFASQKIIKNNGGEKTGEAISPRSFKKVFHYWITL